MIHNKILILKKIAVFAITSVLGLLFLEFLIFKIAPQKTMYYDKINTAPTYALYQYGDTRPVEIKPNLRLYNFSDLYKEYTFSIATDQFGFRREETDLLKPSVVILGDSMTFGYTVSNNEAYPNILDGLYSDCQIINAGKPGAGLNHYIYYLREMLNAGELKNIKQIIVGLNMPGNDWYEMKSLSQKIDPELTQFLRTSKHYKEQKNSIQSKINELLFYSQTYVFLRQTVAPRIKHFILEKKDTSGTEQKEYDAIGLSVEQLIAMMISATKEKNIPITFVFLPERPFYFNKVPLYVNYLQRFMEKNNIPFIDLLPSMKSTYKKTGDFWQPIEGHYNASGHRFIASAIHQSDIIKCN